MNWVSQHDLFRDPGRALGHIHDIEAGLVEERVMSGVEPIRVQAIPGKRGERRPADRRRAGQGTVRAQI